jgi:hypothetical protein
MCIISHYVEDVAATKILVAVDAEKTRQFTCYSNTVTNFTDGNAMILPVPYPNSVRFHDLSNYKNIFDDCKKCFTHNVLLKGSKAKKSSLNSLNVLEVFNVGSYQVSLGMSLADLDRVNGSVFCLSPGCSELLKKNYSHSSFGFIICKLSKGKEDYHPLAYSHDIFGYNIFIPTKHYHQHSPSISYFNTSYYSFGSSNYSSFKPTLKNKHNEWDHDIYLYNVTMLSQEAKRFKSDEYWNNKDLKNKNEIDFNFGTLTSFEKYKIRDDGNLISNNDLIGTCKAY